MSKKIRKNSISSNSNESIVTIDSNHIVQTNRVQIA